MRTNSASASTPGPTTDTRQPWPWWAAAVFALPLAVPYRWPPLLNFYQDAAAYALAGLAAGWLAWRRLRAGIAGIEIARIGLVPLLLAAVLVVHQLLGKIVYVQHFALPFFALMITALAMHVAYRRLRGDPDRTVRAIATALVVGAVLQCAWAFVQAAGFELQGFDLIRRAPGPYRVGGLLAQPNQLSVVIVWGLLGTFYLWSRRRLADPAAAALLSCLLVTLSLAASRASYVYLCVVGPALTVALSRLGRPRGWWLPLSLAAAWPVVDFAIATAARMATPLAGLETLRGFGGASTSARLGFIRDGWQLFLSSPWLGVGWHTASFPRAGNSRMRRHRWRLTPTTRTTSSSNCLPRPDVVPLAVEP